MEKVYMQGVTKYEIGNNGRYKVEFSTKNQRFLSRN